MSDPGERLRTVLDGHANFLCNKELALPKHQPYLVRWMREFLASQRIILRPPSAFPRTQFAGLHLAVLCRWAAAQVNYMRWPPGSCCPSTLPTESYPTLASLSSGSTTSVETRILCADCAANH